MLLQEAGYFVMRFLYDDVLADLPYVLEAILWEVRRRAGDVAENNGEM